MSTRIGTTVTADALLADIRGKRNRLAVAIRGALLDLDRYPAGSFPAARQEQRAHEQQALEMALAALLEPAPEVEPSKGSIDAELRTALRNLDAELGLAR